jgi:F-type H+-transporting ATPase subunit b
MNQFLMLAAAQGGIGEMAASTGREFGFNTSLFVSQIISFSIVAFLLYKFAYGPVLKVLLERRERIEEGLKNAEKIKAELARTEASRLEILNKANAEATKMIADARKDAARVGEQEKQRAVAEAADIIEKARQAAAVETSREREKLRREIAHLVVKATSQVTGKILTMDDQKRLVDETNKQIAA